MSTAFVSVCSCVDTNVITTNNTKVLFVVENKMMPDVESNIDINGLIVIQPS